MNLLCKRCQAIGELLFVGLQPVPYLWLPAVIDLEQAPGGEPVFAPRQVLLNGRFIDCLVPIIPAGIAHAFLFCSGPAPKGGKPGIEHLLLRPLGEEQVQRRKFAPRMAHPGTVPGNPQCRLLRRILKNRIARGLVQGGNQPIDRALSEVAIGKAVAFALLFRVIHKMVVPIPVKGKLFDEESRNPFQPPLNIPLSQLRAVGPGLVAVHKEGFVLFHGPGQVRGHRFQFPLRQGEGYVQSPAVRRKVRPRLCPSALRLSDTVQLIHGHAPSAPG